MHSSQLNFEQELLVPQALLSVRVKFGVTDKVLPINRNELSRGFLKFIDWVVSGGTNYTDRYSNTSGIYRDATKID